MSNYATLNVRLIEPTEKSLSLLNVLNVIYEKNDSFDDILKECLSKVSLKDPEKLTELLSLERGPNTLSMKYKLVEGHACATMKINHGLTEVRKYLDFLASLDIRFVAQYYDENNDNTSNIVVHGILGQVRVSHDAIDSASSDMLRPCNYNNIVHGIEVQFANHPNNLGHNRKVLSGKVEVYTKSGEVFADLNDIEGGLLDMTSYCLSMNPEESINTVMHVLSFPDGKHELVSQLEGYAPVSHFSYDCVMDTLRAMAVSTDRYITFLTQEEYLEDPESAWVARITSEFDNESITVPFTLQDMIPAVHIVRVDTVYLSKSEVMYEINVSIGESDFNEWASKVYREGPAKEKLVTDKLKEVTGHDFKFVDLKDLLKHDSTNLLKLHVNMQLGSTHKCKIYTLALEEGHHESEDSSFEEKEYDLFDVFLLACDVEQVQEEIVKEIANGNLRPPITIGSLDSRYTHMVEKVTHVHNAARSIYPICIPTDGGNFTYNDITYVMDGVNIKRYLTVRERRVSSSDYFWVFDKTYISERGLKMLLEEGLITRLNQDEANKGTTSNVVEMKKHKTTLSPKVGAVCNDCQLTQVTRLLLDGIRSSVEGLTVDGPLTTKTLKEAVGKATRNRFSIYESVTEFEAEHSNDTPWTVAHVTVSGYAWGLDNDVSVVVVIED